MSWWWLLIVPAVSIIGVLLFWGACVLMDRADTEYWREKIEEWSNDDD